MRLKQERAARLPFLKRAAREWRKNRMLYVLTLVPVVFLLLFKYMPLYGLQIAFRNYSVTRGIWESPWVGLKYVQRFLGAYPFWNIMRNTIMISLYSLAAFPVPILLALLLNYNPSRRYRKTVQLVSYAPHFISVVVTVGMILQFLGSRGPLNLLITALGGEAVAFMRYERYFYWILILSDLWQHAGYSAIIYIAALAGVSEELHEAAIVDGADILRRIWYIDLPCIMPTVIIMLILRFGGLLNVDFEKIFLLQNNLNLGVSEVVSTYVYKQGMASSMPQYSYSAAIGLFVSVINCAMLLLMNGTAKKLSGDSLW